MNKLKTFDDYIARLEAAPETPLVANALMMARRCIDYGEARNLDMRMAGNGPTFRESFDYALASSEQAARQPDRSITTGQDDDGRFFVTFRTLDRGKAQSVRAAIAAMYGTDKAGSE